MGRVRVGGARAIGKVISESELLVGTREDIPGEGDGMTRVVTTGRAGVVMCSSMITGVTREGGRETGHDAVAVNVKRILVMDSS